ncbi:CPXCG motif-containing cysteine-rich protein [Pleionea litopenaei]|uniref:CPXCG motif-containing cysteine-rich protein n=1 Tax=Pleionea litopenaei TaxID=3070815 RepID=A0AA51X821_9GAMM|nr:CPXCG motif-containing cysteine-rich protein [Pleionea sp. HL-JVS1]WMS88494.1 CPXCG motif-containing cysteine-rich protein [Pleionea sp. HL-JVS1]
MNTWDETAQTCPYYGSKISLLLDLSVTEQSYIEDCEVCCRPITIHVSVTPNQEVCLQLSAENDVF